MCLYVFHSIQEGKKSKRGNPQCSSGRDTHTHTHTPTNKLVPGNGSTAVPSVPKLGRRARERKNERTSEPKEIKTTEHKKDEANGGRGGRGLEGEGRGMYHGCSLVFFFQFSSVTSDHLTITAMCTHVDELVDVVIEERE